MIERIIHQVWIGPYRMPERERGFVEGMRSKHPDYKHVLWTTRTMPAMPPFLQERFDWRMGEKSYAFAADIARVYLVWLFGGIYFDVDTEVHLGLEGLPLATVDGVFRHHQDGDATFSNDFLGLAKGSALGWSLLKSMEAPAYDFGPNWLGYTVRTTLGLEKEASHALTRETLAKNNLLYMPSIVEDAARLGVRAWNERFRNHALFSWSNENRKKFELGEYQ